MQWSLRLVPKAGAFGQDAFRMDPMMVESDEQHARYTQ